VFRVAKEGSVVTVSGAGGEFGCRNILRLVRQMDGSIVNERVRP
jgi:hypothetical protein